MKKHGRISISHVEKALCGKGNLWKWRKAGGYPGSKQKIKSRLDK